MNEKTIKRLLALPRVSIENGITYYIIPQEEYEKLKDKEQEVKKAKDKIDYMKEYIKTVENARNDLEQAVEKWKHQAGLGSDTTDRLSKQLEQKEQECEELKEKVKKYGEINEQETKDYAELKAEKDDMKNN